MREYNLFKGIIVGLVFATPFIIQIIKDML
jgi:hypothetical protein